MPLTQASDWILAAGALGTTCFGIVEASKWTFVGVAGFRCIENILGEQLSNALQLAYGPKWLDLLKAQYREDAPGQGTIGKSLRQGVRLGLNKDNAVVIANELGTIKGEALQNAVAAAEAGDDLSPEQRAVIGRFEAAADARITSALAKAQDVYLGTVRVMAGLLAIVIALVAGGNLEIPLFQSALLGIAAVPLAPIANDVVGALQAATKALKAK
jgi:hypothetical protein